MILLRSSGPRGVTVPRNVPAAKIVSDGSVIGISMLLLENDLLFSILKKSPVAVVVPLLALTLAQNPLEMSLQLLSTSLGCSSQHISRNNTIPRGVTKFQDHLTHSSHLELCSKTQVHLVRPQVAMFTLRRSRLFNATRSSQPPLQSLLLAWYLVHFKEEG